MLVITRRQNEKVLFPDLQIAVEVLSARPGSVRLGIDAPRELVVLRGELQPGGEAHPPAGGAAACSRSRSALPKRLRRLWSRVHALAAGLARAREQQQLGLTADAEASFRTLEREAVALADQLDAETTPTRIASGRPCRALLVEDDQNERELLAGLLRLSGVEVDAVEDGADALDWLHSREQPDVLLCDMALPRCDGPTVVRTLRRDPVFARLKIFGVTGRCPDSLGLEAGPAGVDRWFLKPLDPAALLAEIDRELRRTPPAQGEIPNMR